MRIIHKTKGHGQKSRKNYYDVLRTKKCLIYNRHAAEENVYKCITCLRVIHSKCIITNQERIRQVDPPVKFKNRLCDLCWQY